MFVEEYELRYSDIDKDGNIKISTVLDLLQDVSIEHANRVGLDSKKLRSVSVACLLASWRVQFVSRVDVFSKVKIKTGLMSITKCEAYRKYEIWQNGECKVIATAVWFTVNTEKMRIARVTEELFTAFESTSEEDNNLPCEKLRPKKNPVLLGKTVVGKRDLDTNNHMNNVKSVETVLNYIPDDFKISELQVKYRKEIKGGEKIKILGNIENGEFYAEIRNENDDLCILMYAEK